ncbi:MAG TPA: inositol monophosphatase family protein [Pirellulaceae bacterium]|nr:inositol monophosphatase family protein [Pirellulaceae bacterium]
MADFLAVCEKAARVGGQVLRDWQGKFRWREKGRRDLVTEADFAAQQAIREVVSAAFPAHEFLGEEDGDALIASQAHAMGYRWIVDPLDGTANYVHGLANFAVSVALEHEGRMVCGVVFDPMSQECFSAVAGEGAKLNGQPIATSGCTLIEQAMIAASFPPHVERNSPEITQFIEVLLRSQSVRRLGSAALNLCYVASGRLDAYWATSVKIWDIAAGMLILQEAGGLITSMTGSPLVLAKPELIASSSPELLHELIGVLKAPS